MMLAALTACGVVSETPSTCSGKMLRVPHDCSTIQDAVDQADGQPLDAPRGVRAIITVATGVYRENLVVPEGTDIVIIAENDGQVKIDGGGFIAIQVGLQASLKMDGLTVSNGDYSDFPRIPTIKAVDSAKIQLDHVIVVTNSIGLMAVNTFETRVWNSTFIGGPGKGGTGILINGQRQGGDGSGGAWIALNAFKFFARGVDSCGDIQPRLDWNEPFDSNLYSEVMLPHRFNSGPCE